MTKARVKRTSSAGVPGDPEIDVLIRAERDRRRDTIQLIAAENVTSPAVLDALASPLTWKTAEGYPGERYHSGCEIVDEVERLAVDRATALFGARHAWVQPLSGSLANLIAFRGVQRFLGVGVGELRVLAMGLDQGGHLSHGSPPNVSRGLLGDIVTYEVDRGTGLLDVGRLERQAMEVRPHLIIAGASSYPRTLDVEAFGAVARRCGALLLTDIAHISGLVATGRHPSPVPHADLVTTSTYKAGGPRGGLILLGDRAPDGLREAMDSAVFPGVQGTPDLGTIGAKAVFFREAAGAAYQRTQDAILRNASRLAAGFSSKGYHVVAGGTDTHMVLLDVDRSLQMTGADAEEALTDVGVYVNRNVLPFERRGARTGSAIRIGTNVVSRIGMGEPEMDQLVQLVDDTLRDGNRGQIRSRVRELARRFPIAPPRTLDGTTPAAVAAAPGRHAPPNAAPLASTGTDS
ncbi:MAG: serine hydroxymethyltransferase [Nitriliruptoraceae bacterium]|nr:serine hydroxymethyltransferase [Nitriliruptoraceae bacterium]